MINNLFRQVAPILGARLGPLCNTTSGYLTRATYRGTLPLMSSSLGLQIPAFLWLPFLSIRPSSLFWLKNHLNLPVQHLLPWSPFLIPLPGSLSLISSSLDSYKAKLYLALFLLKYRPLKSNYQRQWKWNGWVWCQKSSGWGRCVVTVWGI